MRTGQPIGRPPKSPDDLRNVKIVLHVNMLEYRAIRATAPAAIGTWAREVMVREALKGTGVTTLDLPKK